MKKEKDYRGTPINKKLERLLEKKSIYRFQKLIWWGWETT